MKLYLKRKSDLETIFFARLTHVIDQIFYRSNYRCSRLRDWFEPTKYSMGAALAFCVYYNYCCIMMNCEKKKTFNFFKITWGGVGAAVPQPP